MCHERGWKRCLNYALYAQASARAIRRHGIVDPLDQPGTADLSVHVDFHALR